MTHEVQVSIPYFNALPRDCSTNVLHFNRIGAAPDEAELQVLVDNIAVFYGTVYNTAGHLASYADPTNTRFKIYDMDDPTPRSPKLDVTQAVAVNSTIVTTLPPEVAVVCSFRGAGVSGVPLASQRGRLYIGCLGDSCVSLGDETSFPTVNEGFRNYVNSAANSLVENAIIAGFNWVIYSRKLAVTYQVVAGHCDDAFDIQRRRGQSPTIRSTWIG